MRAFLKSIDEEVWVSVLKDLTALSTCVVGLVTPTKVSTWSKNNLDECHWNSKEIHTIFMAISPKEYERVSTRETTKETWYILETTYKETKATKNSKCRC